eukprot:TRINITY_DN12829_c0_g1_i1.p1 TRINITY_DN12829_c0_g1~~TRINITY_DN12829_c0_g1_i1.p1  ORF type:complete len:352 (+),score=84.76 TRINITY_DN12829_c0_g1_i1:121-1176(+)
MMASEVRWYQLAVFTLSALVLFLLLDRAPHGRVEQAAANGTGPSADVVSEAPLGWAGGGEGVMHRYAVVTYMRGDTEQKMRRQHKMTLALMMSVRLSGTAADLVVMVHKSTPHELRRDYQVIGCRVVEISEAVVPQRILDAVTRDSWRIAFDKYKVFHLVEYEKVVLLDADIVVTGPIDDIFTFPSVTMLPNRFYGSGYNSGVIVLEPSHEIINGFFGLLQWMADDLSDDKLKDRLGGTQGILGRYLEQVVGVHNLCKNPRLCPLHEVVWVAPCGTRLDEMQVIANTRIFHFANGWLDPGYLSRDRSCAEFELYCLTWVVNYWKMAYFTAVDYIEEQALKEQEALLEQRSE